MRNDTANESGTIAAIPVSRAVRSEMIAFKDNAIGEIRIKFL